MTSRAFAPIKLYQFPRMFSIPNLSPFCCKLETWLRIAGVAYEVVDTPDPRKGPKGKLPFIEDDGVRIADSSLVIEHLMKSRAVDPDAHLSPSQRATASAVLLFFSAIVGSAGPFLSGVISDALKADMGDMSLGRALLVIVPTMQVLAIAFYFVASRRFLREIVAA